MTEHERHIETAEEAISRLFGDKSASQATTRETLEELIGFIQVMIETLSE